jgi:hypothetical protein
MLRVGAKFTVTLPYPLSLTLTLILTLTLTQGVKGGTQRRVSTFGCGYHGRLGNGTNTNSCIPVTVTQWLPSMDGLQVRQVACGGSHTLVLLEKRVHVGLANPWGVQTLVASFGYGASGALGTGYTQDSFIPVKVRLPKCNPVVKLSALTLIHLDYPWVRVRVRVRDRGVIITFIVTL